MKKNGKTIEVTVRFWVNTVEVHEGGKKMNKQACWDSGQAYMKVNPDLGVKGSKVMFDCLEDISPAIKALLKANKVVMVSGCRPKSIN